MFRQGTAKICATGNTVCDDAGPAVYKRTARHLKVYNNVFLRENARFAKKGWPVRR